MRIAVACPSALPRVIGGQEIVSHVLCRELARQGHEVTFLTRYRQWRAQRGLALGYRTLPLPPKPNDPAEPLGGPGPRLPTGMAAAVYQRLFRFDVWHVHTMLPLGWVLQPTLARLGVPVVMTAHGADVLTHRDSGYGLRLHDAYAARFREVVAAAPLVTAISPTIRSALAEAGLPEARIRDIPNGVAVAEIASAPVDRAAVRRRLGVPEGAPLVLTVGRNVPAKGYGLIPDALRHLRARHPQARWAVVGKGSAEVGADAADLDGALLRLPPVTPAVADDGSLPIPPRGLVDLYRAADVLAVSSNEESFGLMMVEAMAAGLPVVATRTAGATHLIRSGESGLLCGVGDAAGLADGIAAVLDDAALAARLAEGGRRVAEPLDWSAVAARYAACFEDAVAARRSGRPHAPPEAAATPLRPGRG